MREVFGAGTACLVCPINKILYKGEDLVISESLEPMELTKRFYNEICDIHVRILYILILIPFTKKMYLQKSPRIQLYVLK